VKITSYSKDDLDLAADFISKFHAIVDILRDCVELLEASIPDGPDLFLSSPSSNGEPIDRFSQVTLDQYTQVFRKMLSKLKPALALAEKLSLGSKEMPFTRPGVQKLVSDIGETNRFGVEIHFDAYTCLHDPNIDDTSSDLIKTAYAMSQSLYSSLQLSIRKAYPKGQLPPVNLLKPLTVSPGAD
jgi:hypothetical protein